MYVNLGVLPLPGFFGELGRGGERGVEKAQVLVEQYLVLEAGFEAESDVRAVRDDHQAFAVDSDEVVIAQWQALFVVDGILIQQSGCCRGDMHFF
ncbi:hypothetical protein AO387_14365 [Pseudomonas syringae ICMP 11168]|nr:hypothetical protein AO387_14365 [Pseudomonas syringae ICMP 11168]